MKAKVWKVQDMYVMTLDQRDSRRSEDLVPALLEDLNDRSRKTGLLRKFERTAGDEVQGIVTRPDSVVEIIATLLRAEQWNVGLGIGDVDQPLPRSTRAGRGPAFSYARDAVTRAKQGPHHVAVTGSDVRQAEQVETVLWLLAATYVHRTQRGWELIDKLIGGRSRSEAARDLGITQSAVAQRLKAAGWTEERRARRLVSQLLDDPEVR